MIADPETNLETSHRFRVTKAKDFIFLVMLNSLQHLLVDIKIYGFENRL